MNEVSIIGLDLAKKVFQAHGARTDGSVVFRRKLSGAQLQSRSLHLAAIAQACPLLDQRHSRDMQVSENGHILRDGLLGP